MPFHRSLALYATALLGAVVSLGCVDDESDPSAPTPVASLAVHPTFASLEPGQTLTISPVLRDAQGATLTGREVTWVSSNPVVATVNAGLVTGVVRGSAVITASAEGNSATTTITVQTSVAAVEIVPESPSIGAGSSVQLHAIPRGAGGTRLEGRVVSWSTSNPRIAAVSAGKVRGLRVGSAEITAMAEGKSGSTTVTVLPNISGQWILTTSFSDSARGFSCTGSGRLTIRQTGGGFGGTLEQTGSCGGPAGSLDNSGSFELLDASLSATRLDFIHLGQLRCGYVGELSGTPPASATGPVHCTGEVGGAQAQLQGQWDMRR